MDRLWLATVFLVALVSAGMPLWLMPYDRIELPSSWLLPGLLVIVPLSAGTRLWGLAGIPATVATLTSAMLAANMLRIAYDTAGDATSHNLWPLELVMAAFAGAAFSLAGGVLGWIAALIWGAVRRQ
jgi:hypothetical protein